MRDIKFRVWDTITKTWYLNPVTIETLWEEEFWSRTPVSPIWMQYTGLKDKNGVEIYYQDIIKADENIYRIEYIDDYLQPCVFTGEQWKWYLKGSNHFKYCQQEDNIQDYFLWQIESYESEVIGNIHQNPELLS